MSQVRETNVGKHAGRTEENDKIRKPLLGYLRCLKDKRNDVIHPNKRFKQIEGKRVFINVVALIREMFEEKLL